MSFNFALKQQACLLQLHPTTWHVGYNCTLLACISVRAISRQQISMTSRYICYPWPRPAVMSLCSYPTNGLVSTIAPDHQACMLQLHLTSSHAFIICLLSVCSAVCLLQFHFISIHVYYISTRPSAMAVTIASNHLPCLPQLRLTSSHDGNEHLQHADLLLRFFGADTLHLN